MVKFSKAVKIGTNLCNLICIYIMSSYNKYLKRVGWQISNALFFKKY